MDSDRYTIILSRERSHDEWAWVARVPELPGCAATEATAEAALKHIKESIQTYIASELELGRFVPPPSPEPSGHFSIRVPRWVHRELKLQADADGVSLNQYVSSVLSFAAGQRAVRVIYREPQTEQRQADLHEHGRPTYRLTSKRAKVSKQPSR